MKKDELNAIRDKMKNRIAARAEGDATTRVVVGMATCGIAAGASPVFKAMSDMAAEKKLGDVNVVQTGCVGLCEYEPIVEVYAPGKEKVTYVNVTADMAKQIMERHIIGGMVAAEYTIGEMMKK